jgi:acyl-CoA thioester hydrolase
MSRLRFIEPVHTYHIDFSGHVSNIVYIQWMEVGRLKLLEAVGLPVHNVAKEQGLLPTLAATEISYKRQLFLGDTVRVELWLSRLKKVSAVMEFLFMNGQGEEVARGRQTGLFIDAVSHRPKPLSREERDRFLVYLEKEQE